MSSRRDFFKEVGMSQAFALLVLSLVFVGSLAYSLYTSSPTGQATFGGSSTCNNNGVCNKYRGETPDNCPNDCKQRDRGYCGDGIVRTGGRQPEECDDGNKVETDQCSSQCTKTSCGDGYVQRPNGNGLREQCDDGNTQSDDGCSSRCTREYCGNGVPEGSEQCDDGNTQSGDGCSSTCAIEAVCGNGRVDSGEECDDGNLLDNDGCHNDCTLEYCGNYRVEGAEECDNLYGPCGNGGICLDDCSCAGGGSGGVCPDGFCDATENSCTCAADCGSACGDGCVTGNEQCEKDSDCSSGLVCTGCQCAPPTGGSSCGNNILETGEQCDGTSDAACPGLCLADCTCGTGSGGCDNDNDGYDGGSCSGLDCNDNDASINPGISELCADGIDNDCDTFVDCGDTECAADYSCTYQQYEESYDDSSYDSDDGYYGYDYGDEYYYDEGSYGEDAAGSPPLQSPSSFGQAPSSSAQTRPSPQTAPGESKPLTLTGKKSFGLGSTLLTTTVIAILALAGLVVYYVRMNKQQGGPPGI